MNSFTLAGSIIGGTVYFVLWVQILRGLKQNFATWILWSLIDVVATLSTLIEKGNFLLPVTYAAGSLLIAMTVFFRFGMKRISWGPNETMTAVLVVICLVAYEIFGGIAGIVVSTISVGIAGIPQLYDFWVDPWHAPFLAYFGFFAANILSTIGGTNWSLEERYYPFFCSVTCFVVVLVIARRWWLKDPRTQRALDES
jgi:hypothetical protein